MILSVEGGVILFFVFLTVCFFLQEADTVGIFTLHKCFSVESEDKQLFACPMQLLWINI